MTEVVEVIVDRQPSVIEVVQPGPQGPRGAAGPPGAEGRGVPAGGTTGQLAAKASNVDYDVEWVSATGGGGGASFYRHVQSSPAAVWTVTHNLGYRPGGIFIVDSGGTEQHGRVTHIDTNTLTIEFFVAGAAVAFAGEAELS